MLPFLKKKDDFSVSMPAEVKTRDPDSEPEFDSLEACGQDLVDAIHAKDAKGVAAALRAGFLLCDSEPHEEAE